MNKQNEDLMQVYDFLKEINKFKSVERMSLVKEGGRRESDAEHTWHLVMAVWLYSKYFEREIDLFKAIKIALVHDLVEIYAGDIYGGATTEARGNKEEAELQAAQKLFSQLPQKLGQEFMALWQEYENRNTAESLYVWSLDKLCPRVQIVITKKDMVGGMFTSNKRLKKQEEIISKFSESLKIILDRINKDRGIL